MADLMPQMFGGGGASKELQDIMDKGRDAGMRVRDVNRRYARQISGLLPESSKAAFDAEFEKESYPMAFRDTRISRQLAAVKGFADLTAEQKESIAQLSDTFTKENESLTRQLIEATDKMESTVTADQIMAMFRPGGNDDSPVGQINRKRRDLNQGTQDKLEAILTPEQVKRLPQDDRARGGPGGDTQQQGQVRRGRRGNNANDGGGDAPPPAPRRLN
jgi:Spy/CpxP family protein refolding chaperone